MKNIEESWPWPTDVSDRNATHKGDVKRGSRGIRKCRRWCDFIERVYIHLKIIQINTTKTSSTFHISSWFLKESVFQNHSCWISFLETSPSFHGLKKTKRILLSGTCFLSMYFHPPGKYHILSQFGACESVIFPTSRGRWDMLRGWWFRNSANHCV